MTNKFFYNRETNQVEQILDQQTAARVFGQLPPKASEPRSAEWAEPRQMTLSESIKRIRQPTRSDVLEEVKSERVKQDRKWGEQNHPNLNTYPGSAARKGWEEAMKRIYELASAAGELTWELILDEEVAEAYAAPSTEALRAELIQVAAVAIAWIECLDRNK